MMAWIKNKAKDVWQSQWVDHSNVVPKYRWSDVDRAFHLVSPAGHIIFKPKTDKDIERFRNKYINRFMMIEKDALDQEDKNKLFFCLYEEIRKKEKVKYKANVHTRLKGTWCSFMQ